MGFWDIKKEGENKDKPSIRVRGDVGTHTFTCPACNNQQRYHGFWVVRCGVCWQRVAVCNVLWVCDYEH